MKLIDACGLACPEPVILCRNAVAAGEFPFAIEVNDQTPKENILRYLKNNKHSAEIENLGDIIRIIVNN
ncbi:MAG: sulfurtransferase TusA family protein [Eubacteriales bacterium]|nr:sulfurtransferase TusA family protein [Eubacteriales bacterium]